MSLRDRINKNIRGDGRSATVKKNIIASIGIKGISILISFALVPLTIGYVSSELYGVWLTLSSILTWLTFLDIGFSQGLKNKLAEAVATCNWGKGKSLVSTTYFMMVIIFLPVWLILEIIIPFVDWASLLNVNEQYNDEIIRTLHILAVTACLQMIVNVIVSVVAAFQKVALSSTFVPVGNVLSLIIIFILTKTSHPSLVSLALTLATMPVIVTIVASIVLFSGKFKDVRPNIKSIRTKYVKDLFGLGYKFFIINIQSVILFQSTNILISNVSSPNDVTTYNIAYKLLNIAMMAFTIITAPLWPAYTDAYVRGDLEWMINTKQKIKKILMFSIICCIITAICSPIIYKIWIGDKVVIPFLMTILVAIYVSLYCWNSMNGTMIVGMGKIELTSRICLVGMFFHIPLSYFLSNYIGAYGVIISMILINFFYASIQEYQVNLLLYKKATGIWIK